MVKDRRFAGDKGGSASKTGPERAGRSGGSAARSAGSAPARPVVGSGSTKVGSGSTTVGTGPKKTGSGSTKARQSVAAARRTSKGANRTQLIIGAVAVVLIIAIIVVGLVLNKKQTAAPVTDYGPSTNSVATASAGVVTVNNGTTPPVIIDIYQDAMCPICQAFEQQYGQQINQAVDTGKLAVRYHMLTFLDPASASKTYSTRAAAALLCVAADAKAPKGTVLKYLDNLYADGTKPEENGSTDLTDQQLADLAVKNGATTTSSGCITAKTNVAVATTAAQSGNAELQKATGQVATPTVLRDGAPLATNSTTWLSSIIS